MTVQELFKGIADIDCQTVVQGLTCDSRRVEPGWVFVCINGVAVDGHKYAAGAVKSGAAVVVTERPLGLEREITLPETRKVWAHLCANWFGNPSKDIRMIGITGTNGKTTMTYMIKQLLEAAGKKTGLIGTIQNMVGDEVLAAHGTTPDAYELQSLLRLMVNAGCEYVVMEVSSHALDQERCAGCEFEEAVFTNLTQDHLDYHKTMENYCAAKCRLFRNAKRAIVNADDAWASTILSQAKGETLTFSVKGNEATYMASNVETTAAGVSFDLKGNGQDVRVTLPIPGFFSVYNAMASAICVMALGVDAQTVANHLAQVRGIKGRAEVVPTNTDYTVVIDYAHTPDGLDNICSTMKQCTKGRLITLFGCGGERDPDKRPKMGAVAANYSDMIVLTSDNPRTEDPMLILKAIEEGLPEGCDYVVIEDRKEAIAWALHHAKAGDTVLLAGKGHETYQVRGKECVHLDEREVVAEVLGQA